MSVLSIQFYQRDTVQVARELLGKNLVRYQDGITRQARIIEVEAYDGPHDLASHASRGRRTPRNLVMYGPAGRWYVYLVYGMHWMLNVVTGEDDYPAAVLIRAVESVSGPGRLTKYYNVDAGLNGQSVTFGSGMYITDSGWSPDPDQIIATPRIGVDYAGPVWSIKPFRFYIDGMLK